MREREVLLNAYREQLEHARRRRQFALSDRLLTKVWQVQGECDDLHAIELEVTMVVSHFMR